MCGKKGRKNFERKITKEEIVDLTWDGRDAPDLVQSAVASLLDEE
jgi:hypothetical protein